MLRQFQDFSIFHFGYYNGNGFDIPQHFPECYDLFLLRLLLLPKLYCLLITHFKWLNRRQYCNISLVDHLILVSLHVNQSINQSNQSIRIYP